MHWHHSSGSSSNAILSQSAHLFYFHKLVSFHNALKLKTKHVTCFLDLIMEFNDYCKIINCTDDEKTNHTKVNGEQVG